ncbi:Cysteine/Histidine-rich C1 domain family protein [Melia azedarach]|uniref:Cysteine/Histidine-rich C1 domain family protein n=1 Tax=Melia azedarach TaxID=155640 RepID=A0ACC1Y8V2_MELAZ|nr:Cysteine/Histidine-rich C1 domain family protein [Melia azedarach]
MGTTHPSHPDHELERKTYRKPYTCDGCKELGFGSRYRCEQCNFDLHEHCIFTTPTAHHDFFRNSTFKFLHQPPTKCSHYCPDCQRYCDACGKPIRGFVYHCKEKGWDLHPCCLKLPNSLSIKNVKFDLSDKVSLKCIWCKKKKLEGTVSGIRGWSYVSKCEEYHFHVYCATEMMLDGWQNGAFNDDRSLALENLELPTDRRLSTNRRRGNKFIKMVKMVFRTIIGILLGDPTVILAGLLVELIGK